MTLEIPKDIISTSTGVSFNVVNPRVEDIRIEDIAHALSLMCRASGHFCQFYSVAQHSINCYKEAKVRGLSKEVQLTCLLHDASEAYMCDIPRPIKSDEYYAKEEKLQRAIFSALAPQVYGLFFEDEAEWKNIDDAMLYWEFETYYKVKTNFNPIPNKDQKINIELSKQFIPFEIVQTEFIMIYNELMRDIKSTKE